jgi:ADP-ribose pyrophosphatase
MPNTVKIEKKQLLLDDVFKVEEAFVTYEHFDGRMGPVVRRLNFERSDSAAVVLHHTGNDSVLLVEQFRYPTYAKGPGWMTELVAGVIDGNETAEAAMRREVLEETGYRASALEHVSTFYVSPGGTSERITLFYGKISEGDRTGKGGGLARESEDIRLCEIPLAEAFEKLAKGEFEDAKTIIGLMWLQRKLGR